MELIISKKYWEELKTMLRKEYPQMDDKEVEKARVHIIVDILTKGDLQHKERYGRKYVTDDRI